MAAVWQKNSDGKYEQKKVPQMRLPSAPQQMQQSQGSVVQGTFAPAPVRRPGISFQCSPQHHHKRRKAA